MNSESIIFQNLSPTPTASGHLFGQDFPPPKKVQPTFLPSCDIQKKTWFDSPRIKSQTNTPTRSIYIIFMDFWKTKIYIRISLWGNIWILHGLINDVIYIAPGGGEPMSHPRHSLIWAAWMQLASVTKRMACVHLRPRWESVEIFCLSLGMAGWPGFFGFVR